MKGSWGACWILDDLVTGVDPEGVETRALWAIDFMSFRTDSGVLACSVGLLKLLSPQRCSMIYCAFVASFQYSGNGAFNCCFPALSQKIYSPGLRPVIRVLIPCSVSVFV